MLSDASLNCINFFTSWKFDNLGARLDLENAGRVIFLKATVDVSNRPQCIAGAAPYSCPSNALSNLWISFTLNLMDKHGASWIDSNKMNGFFFTKKARKIAHILRKPRHRERFWSISIYF